MEAQSPVGLVDAASASALLKPVRLRIVEALRAPGSASTVARQLGLPRQRVNYHVRELERHGLLEEVGTRRRRNCTERILRATARSFLVSPGALGAVAADPDSVQDRLSSAYLLATAARTIEDVGVLRAGAEEAGKRLATLTLETEVRFASPARQAEFARELSACLVGLAGRYHDAEAPDGRTFRFMLAGHPAVPRKGGDSGGEAGPELRDDTKEEP